MAEMIFDTHAHYFDRKFNEIEGGAEAILESEDFLSAVCGVVNVGTNCDNALRCLEQAAKYDFMYAAVGIHPSDAQTECKLAPAEEIERLRSIIGDEQNRKEKKIVAIGEIGYDYYWQPVDRELQKYYFEAQMKLAGELGLPVIIHDRDAHGDCMEMIKKFPSVKGVFHSFSGSAEMALELVKMGWYISFSGTVTFKNAKKPKEAAAVVPLDRILIETDAPYLAPTPHRGELNRSSYVELTAQEIASIRGISPEEVERATTENAKRLFRIK